MLVRPVSSFASKNTLVVSSNQTTGINLFTLAGSPTVAKVWDITLNTGVTISSSSTGTPAVTVGAFPAGSVLRITNNATIKGRGGAGGLGSGSGVGGAGNAGGPAMSLSTGYTVLLDNTSGNIWGGGGGQGGQGLGYQGVVSGEGCAINAISGSNGGAGAGPDAATGGGDYGVAGPTGSTGVNLSSGGCPGLPGEAGGTGGDAGKAINLNGNTVTWLGGNNSTQVKGAVS